MAAPTCVTIDGRRYVVTKPTTLPQASARIVQSELGTLLAVPRRQGDPPQSKVFMVRLPGTQGLRQMSLTFRDGCPYLVAEHHADPLAVLQGKYNDLHRAHLAVLRSTQALMQEHRNALQQMHALRIGNAHLMAELRRLCEANAQSGEKRKRT